MKIRYMLAALVIIALIAGCQKGEDNTINVAGSSELTVKPDKAEVWAGISIVKDTAQEAQNEANKVVNDIIDELRYKGISEQDISTENLNIYEERTWTDKDGSKLVGWRATQTLKVKTTDLKKVGEIVDVAVTNGANQINNIQFELSDTRDKEYRKQAISEATQDARGKAEAIAESLGVKLGKIKTVSEANYFARPYLYAMEAKAGGDMVAEAANVLPQDVTVTANINLVYTVK